MKAQHILLLFFISFQSSNSKDILSSIYDPPKLTGKLVYHSYTSYDAEDSQMYIYDFKTNTIDNISKNWSSLHHPMNGHFSPDGKYIVFMAIGHSTDSWDIFLYDTEKKGEPENLTPRGDYRDEDPKYSHSGKTIAFKRDDRLAEINLETKEIKYLGNRPTQSESMPYYSSDDKKLLVGVGEGSEAYIGSFDIATKTMKTVADRYMICDYYPINIDEESFYFSSHYSANNDNDQVYKGYWSAASPVRLPFNTKYDNFSDAYPIGNGWLFLVSTKEEGKGGYDLYIAHETSGVIYSLDLYNENINSEKEELGPAYFGGNEEKIKFLE